MLNVGCGNKFHTDWVNVDMRSNSPHVLERNLIKGIPFPDNSFNVVYHSQVLEHIPKENAPFFIKECFRVLRPGGILRVVCPDLENIVEEYRKYLHQNLNDPTPASEANYDWIMLELFDQTVRNSTGGMMADHLRRPDIINEDYVLHRTGHVGQSIREYHLSGNTPKGHLRSNLTLKLLLKKGIPFLWRKIRHKLSSHTTRVGAFRLGGEVHMWMYDRYSLGRLMKNCGFIGISKKDPHTSDIPDWDRYELDVKGELVYDPTSLFMEGRKP